MTSNTTQDHEINDLVKAQHEQMLKNDDFIQDAGGLARYKPTLRDYFAAKASEKDIQAHIVGPYYVQILHDQATGIKREKVTPLKRTREEAKFAYADSMLKARGGEA